MKGGSFLSHIQTAFHQFCLIGPSVRAVGNGWDENATNGLKLMLASLTSQIYNTVQRLSIFSFLLFSISACPPSSLFHLPPSLLFCFFFSKRTISCHLPRYQFNSSCFSNSPFPLHLHLSCQIIWQQRFGSIFHFSTMVTQWHQSCTTCGWIHDWIAHVKVKWPAVGMVHLYSILLVCTWVCVCVWEKAFFKICFEDAKVAFSWTRILPSELECCDDDGGNIRMLWKIT